MDRFSAQAAKTFSPLSSAFAQNGVRVDAAALGDGKAFSEFLAVPQGSAGTAVTRPCAEENGSRRGGGHERKAAVGNDREEARELKEARREARTSQTERHETPRHEKAGAAHEAGRVRKEDHDDDKDVRRDAEKAGTAAPTAAASGKATDAADESENSDAAGTSVNGGAAEGESDAVDATMVSDESAVQIVEAQPAEESESKVQDCGTQHGKEPSAARQDKTEAQSHEPAVSATPETELGMAAQVVETTAPGSREDLPVSARTKGKAADTTPEDIEADGLTTQADKSLGLKAPKDSEEGAGKSKDVRHRTGDGEHGDLVTVRAASTQSGHAAPQAGLTNPALTGVPRETSGALQASSRGQGAVKSADPGVNGSAHLLDGARAFHAADATGHTGAARAVKSGPSALMNVVEQVSLYLSRNARNGVEQMTLQLKPVDLGRVDIKLDFSDGRVQGTILADNPQTLELLIKDQRNLERALQDAGFQTDSGSLSFSLRDGQAFQRDSGETGRGKTQAFLPADEAWTNDNDGAGTDIPVLTPGRVNLRV